jgi:hypothetical protein
MLTAGNMVSCVFYNKNLINMKEDLIRKFVEKLDCSYNYKTVNERQNIINDLCEIAGIEQLTIPRVSKCTICGADTNNSDGLCCVCQCRGLDAYE